MTSFEDSHFMLTYIHWVASGTIKQPEIGQTERFLELKLGTGNGPGTDLPSSLARYSALEAGGGRRQLSPPPMRCLPPLMGDP